MTALTVVAECVAAAGDEDRLRTALEAMIEPSLDEAGCLAFRLYADPNDPGRMAVIEEWADEAALEAHRTTAHYRHVADVLALVLARPVVLRSYSAGPPGGAG